jgi:hypothetical protein
MKLIGTLTRRESYMASFSNDGYGRIGALSASGMSELWL